MSLRVLSLFSGCGNSDAGLYDAAAELGVEVEVVAAYDNWPKAVEVYNANLHPVAQVCDLKTLQRADLPPHDLVIGGPPCQPFSMAGKRTGHDDPRNCLPDFIRLVGDKPYLMENVVPRLINAPFAVKVCAADFGDVTSRKRWFYSNYLLHVIETPGPRRIRDIRDHAEDERVLKKRNGCMGSGNGHHGHYDSLDSLSAHSWHGHDIRGSGKLVAIETPWSHLPPDADEERLARIDDSACEVVADKYGTVERDEWMMLPSLRATSFHGPPYTLRLGLRGNSASASAFEDDEILGSVLSNSFHANEASRIVACRNPSLLEMQRAHSFPDSWDWVGATKTNRGKMIANSIPRGMAKAVCRAMLIALGVAESAA